jgi:hypothetical protein
VPPVITDCPRCRQLPTIARPYGLIESYGWVHVCPRLVQRVESRGVQYQTYGAAVRGWNAWCDQQSLEEPMEARFPDQHTHGEPDSPARVRRKRKRGVPQTSG